MPFTNPNPTNAARLNRARRVASQGWTTTVRPASVGDGWVVEILDRSLMRVAIALDIDLGRAMDRAEDDALETDGPSFDRACDYCGADITSRRIDAKFCGDACRVAHHRGTARV